MTHGPDPVRPLAPFPIHQNFRPVSHGIRCVNVQSACNPKQ